MIIRKKLTGSDRSGLHDQRITLILRMASEAHNDQLIATSSIMSEYMSNVYF